MPVSADVYKQIGRSAAGAVSVITANDTRQNSIVALTVSSFVTLSFDPPLVMFAIQHNADSFTAMVESKAFGVSLLGAHQADVGQRFATKGRDKISGTRFDTGTVLQVPLIPESLMQIECRTTEIFKSGDHVIIVGMVESAKSFEGEPLLYYSRQFGTFRPFEPKAGA